MMAHPDSPGFSLHHLLRPPQQRLSSPAPMLLMLHGYGSHEHDLFGLTPYLDPRLLVISAAAPYALGPGAWAWFELEFTDTGVNVVDPSEVDQSRTLLKQFLQELIDHYQPDPKGIYLMGFSQGGIMSLDFVLSHPDQIAGAVIMSGRLLPDLEARIGDLEELAGLPIIVVHGVADGVLPIANGRQIQERLQALPVDLVYREYDMGHEINRECLLDILDWLKRQLGDRH